MSDFPVMFTLRDAVSGNGYLAGVTVTGRATMRQEEDGKWWMHGVRPSGISSPGSTPEEAFLRFRESYKYVLFDLAQDSKTYEDFRSAVEALYLQRNEIEEACWETAFQGIRAGAVVTNEYFSNLPKQAPESRPTQYTVERLDKPESKFKPTDNVPDLLELPKAA